MKLPLRAFAVATGNTAAIRAIAPFLLPGQKFSAQEFSALHLAPHGAAADLLLKMGLAEDVNQKNSGGLTPLQFWAKFCTPNKVTNLFGALLGAVPTCAFGKRTKNLLFSFCCCLFFFLFCFVWYLFLFLVCFGPCSCFWFWFWFVLLFCFFVFRFFVFFFSRAETFLNQLWFFWVCCVNFVS